MDLNTTQPTKTRHNRELKTIDEKTCQGHGGLGHHEKQPIAIVDQLCQSNLWDASLLSIQNSMMHNCDANTGSLIQIGLHLMSKMKFIWIF